ncbi:MAG: GPW/gp25 family protein [Candidatus Bathyarchaeia archaeon]
MAVTRADLITQTQKKIETYSDFTNNLARHPITNQLVVLKNEDAVRQAFKNLIYTNIFERFFNPFFGTDINRSLFELDTPFLIEDLKTAINLSARQFEPRIQIINLSIVDNGDANSISINILFQLVNNPTPILVPILLKRIR